MPLFSYRGAGLATIEMELSVLLVTASLRGLVAGGVVVVDAVNPGELVDAHLTGGRSPAPASARPRSDGALTRPHNVAETSDV